MLEKSKILLTLSSDFSKLKVAVRMKSSWLKDISNIYADNGLSAFQKVLVVKALRPDYLHTALSKLAAKQLGKCRRFALHSKVLLICKFCARR